MYATGYKIDPLKIRNEQNSRISGGQSTTRRARFTTMAKIQKTEWRFIIEHLNLSLFALYIILIGWNPAQYIIYFLLSLFSSCLIFFFTLYY